MKMTVLLASAAFVLASIGTASAASIRECNERETTFAAKRACAGLAGTASTRGMFRVETPSNPGNGGEDPGTDPGNGGGDNGGGDDGGNPGTDPGTDPTHPGDHGPTKPGNHHGWGKDHGKGKHKGHR